MDFNLARFNMVQQQIRTWSVLDSHLLELLGTIPREQFVPSNLRTLAFSDTFISIDYNQVMLPPKIVGRMLQALKLSKNDRVLEIGTGSGYITALLAKLAKEVVSIEIIPELADIARQNIEALHIDNVTVEVGDGCMERIESTPYDAIIITGSLSLLPKTFKNQLAVAGRLGAFVGTSPCMSAVLLTKTDTLNWQEECLFETDIPPLLHGPQLNHFQF